MVFLVWCVNEIIVPLSYRSGRDGWRRGRDQSLCTSRRILLLTRCCCCCCEIAIFLINTTKKDQSNRDKSPKSMGPFDREFGEVKEV